MPAPPGRAGIGSTSPQLPNTLLNEILTPAEFGPDRDRNIERVAPVIVALAGIEVRLNAINPTQEAGAICIP